MNILLCYGYHPETTAVYFDRALCKHHSVFHVTTPWRDRRGYAPNEDVYALVERGILPKPDLVLFIESGMPFFPRGLERFECPTAAYIIDVHSAIWVRQNYAYFFDHLFICHKDYVGYFEELGFPSVHWLPIACDPEIHGQIPAERVYDIGFVGGIEHHPERRRLLLGLERRYKLNDFRRHYPKEQLTAIYSRSRIAFNYPANRDLNMRVFEALAGGALLVTSPIENGIHDLLRAGEHFIEFRDDRELHAALEYYLAHDRDREHIAQAGCEAALREHTYEKRCEIIFDALRGAAGATGSAMARRMTPARLREAYGKIYSNFRLVDAAFDEFETAWRAKAGRLAASKTLGTALLRRLNATTQLSQVVRKALSRN